MLESPLREILIAVAVAFAAVVLSSGIWVPLLLLLRDRRMRRHFWALAGELGIVTPQGLADPLSFHYAGAHVQLALPTRSDPFVLSIATTLPNAALGGTTGVFRCEGGVDKLGKVLGINREVQTGDPAFDDRVYIDSDAPDPLIEALLRDDQRRRAVLGLVEAGFSVEVDGRQVTGSRRRPKAAHFAAPAVLSVVHALAVLSPNAPPSVRVEVAKTRTFPIAFLVGAVVLGLAGPFLLVASMAAYQPLSSDLYWAALGTAAVLFLLSVPISAVAIRGRSSSFHTLGWVVGLLLYLIPCYATTLSLSVNGVLDAHAPERRRAFVVEKWETNGKNGHHFHLRLRLGGKPPVSVDRQVEEGMYRAIAASENVWVVVGSGALGWDWFRGIERTKPRS